MEMEQRLAQKTETAKEKAKNQVKERQTFPDRASFRSWLQQQGERKGGVWLTFGKGGGVKTLSAEEALEEALCFGWIDGQFDRIDETVYLKYFAPRRKGSPWSERNKELAQKLIGEGRMTEKGVEAIERAKKEGTWDAPKAPGLTEEQLEGFAELVRAHAKAFENFGNMSPSVRKQFAGFYYDAKKEETRLKRLEKILGLLELNKRLM